MEVQTFTKVQTSRSLDDRKYTVNPKITIARIVFWNNTTTRIEKACFVKKMNSEKLMNLNSPSIYPTYNSIVNIPQYSQGHH